MEDFYRLLGVSADATMAEIKTRYRYLCHAFHPDKFATDAHRQTAEDDFKGIAAAYAILSNPIERQRYDDLVTPAPYTEPPSTWETPPTPSGYDYQSPPTQPPRTSPAEGAASQFESAPPMQPPASSVDDQQGGLRSLFPLRHGRLRFALLFGAFALLGGIATAILDNGPHKFDMNVWVSLTLSIILVWSLFLPRVRDIGLHGACCVLLIVPIINILFLVVLLVLPTGFFSRYLIFGKAAQPEHHSAP